MVEAFRCGRCVINGEGAAVQFVIVAIESFFKLLVREPFSGYARMFVLEHAPVQLPSRIGTQFVETGIHAIFVQGEESVSAAVLNFNLLALQHITVVVPQFGIQDTAYVRRLVCVGLARVGLEPNGVSQHIGRVVHVQIDLFLRNHFSELVESAYERAELSTLAECCIHMSQYPFFLLFRGEVGKPSQLLLFHGSAHHFVAPKGGVVSRFINCAYQVGLHLVQVIEGQAIVAHIVQYGTGLQLVHLHSCHHAFHLGESAVVGVDDFYYGRCRVALAMKVHTHIQCHVSHFTFETQYAIALCVHIQSSFHGRIGESILHLQVNAIDTIPISCYNFLDVCVVGKLAISIGMASESASCVNDVIGLP